MPCCVKTGICDKNSGYFQQKAKFAALLCVQIASKVSYDMCMLRQAFRIFLQNGALCFRRTLRYTEERQGLRAVDAGEGDKFFLSHDSVQTVNRRSAVIQAESAARQQRSESDGRYEAAAPTADNFRPS